MMNKTALSMIFGVLAIFASAVHATDIYLCAGAFSKAVPDGTVTMWGLARIVDHSPAELAKCGTADAPYTSPGPRLKVSAYDTTALNIHVQNNLPVGFSLVIPGQNDTNLTPVTTTDSLGRTRVTSFTHLTAPGTAGTYTYNSVTPGTYAYHGASNVNKQVQMGLYGALTKNKNEPDPYVFPETYAEAYPGVFYDRDIVLFYSEIDPVVHSNVAVNANTAVTVDYTPQYFLINGEDKLDIAKIDGTGLNVNKRILLRFINMGLQTHSPTLMGMRMSVLAEDGKPYSHAKDQNSVTLRAGSSRDALVVPAVAGVYTIYDRMLTLTNHFYAGTVISPMANPGGQVATLEIVPAVVDTDGDGVADSADNCTLVPNVDQRDTNKDGFGSICDPDLNNDGIVNIQDYSIFRSKFNSSDTDADFNGDGVVNLSDYSIFRAYFGKPPGPAGTLQ